MGPKRRRQVDLSSSDESGEDIDLDSEDEALEGVKLVPAADRAHKPGISISVNWNSTRIALPPARDLAEAKLFRDRTIIALLGPEVAQGRTFHPVSRFKKEPWYRKLFEEENCFAQNIGFWDPKLAESVERGERLTLSEARGVLKRTVEYLQNSGAVPKVGAAAGAAAGSVRAVAAPASAAAGAVKAVVVAAKKRSPPKAPAAPKRSPPKAEPQAGPSTKRTKGESEADFLGVARAGSSNKFRGQVNMMRAHVHLPSAASLVDAAKERDRTILVIVGSPPGDVALNFPLSVYEAEPWYRKFFPAKGEGPAVGYRDPGFDRGSKEAANYVVRRAIAWLQEEGVVSKWARQSTAEQAEALLSKTPAAGPSRRPPAPGQRKSGREEAEEEEEEASGSEEEDGEGGEEEGGVEEEEGASGAPAKRRPARPSDSAESKRAFRGVTGKDGRWSAILWVRPRTHHVVSCTTREGAARCYDRARIAVYGTGDAGPPLNYPASAYAGEAWYKQMCPNGVPLKPLPDLSDGSACLKHAQGVLAKLRPLLAQYAQGGSKAGEARRPSRASAAAASSSSSSSSGEEEGEEGGEAEAGAGAAKEEAVAAKPRAPAAAGAGRPAGPTVNAVVPGADALEDVASAARRQLFAAVAPRAAEAGAATSSSSSSSSRTWSPGDAALWRRPGQPEKAVVVVEACEALSAVRAARPAPRAGAAPVLVALPPATGPASSPALAAMSLTYPSPRRRRNWAYPSELHPLPTSRDTSHSAWGAAEESAARAAAAAGAIYRRERERSQIRRAVVGVLTNALFTLEASLQDLRGRSEHVVRSDASEYQAWRVAVRAASSYPRLACLLGWLLDDLQYRALKPAGVEARKREWARERSVRSAGALEKAIARAVREYVDVGFVMYRRPAGPGAAGAGAAHAPPAAAAGRDDRDKLKGA
eukprot:tig00020572_g11563.t1